MLNTFRPLPTFLHRFYSIVRFQSTSTGTAQVTNDLLAQPPAFKSRRHEGGRSDREKTTPYGWLMLSVPLATFGLGCWQVQRKQWKEQLIKELELQTNKAPVAFPKDNIETLNDMEYQSVRVKGQFLHDRELILGPRSLIEKGGNEAKGGLITRQDSSIGYLVVTPFLVENTNHIILVNRGWVPRKFTKPETRVDGNRTGITELVGVVRKPENRPQFSPKASSEQFLYRNIPDMCLRTGAEPYYLDANAASSVPGGPVGGQTRVTLRNDHLSYLVTWYSLSGITAYLWYRQIYKRIPR